MRKKIIKTFTASVFMCCLLSATAFADSATVTGSEVNMRSGPGLNYRIVDCLPKGTSVTVTNRSNSDWYAVSYNGQDGFMSSGYLKINDDYQNADIVTSDGVGYIDGMYVRFRSGPSTGSSILGEYNRGKEVQITGTSGDWTACIINGQSGYIYSDYISRSVPSYDDDGYKPGYEESFEESFSGSDSETDQNSGTNNSDNSDGGISIIDPEEPSEPAESPEPEEPSVPVESPESEEPSVPAESPEPEEPSVPAESPEPAEPSKPDNEVTPTEHKAGYINGDYVRFRTGPSTSHSIIDSYNRGTELTITGVSGDWTACTINGVDGFVYSSYVTEKDTASSEPLPPEGSPSTDGEPGYITGNNVRFRSAPSTSSEILGEFFYGNEVIITGTQGDWTAVTYDGQAGYVFSSYVKAGEYSHQSTGGSELGRKIADYALQYVGYNYSWGGMSPETGFDCSGFTSYVFAHFGYSLNRVACDQARNGVHVEPNDMQAGDIICFYSGGDYIGHVGIYIGNNMFVHAANSRIGVVTSELSGYYQDRGYEVRRII